MTDFEGFALMLRRTFLACSAGQKEPDPQTVELYWELFQHVEIRLLRHALGAHARDPERGRFPPRPADITFQLQRMDGHPEADEAWAIAVKAADEANTVVWTEPMAQAWNIAGPLFDRTPGQAASAFKERYANLVAEERQAGRPARWVTSLGFNKDQAQAAIQVAQVEGRLKELGHEERLLLEGKPRTLKPPAWMKERWDALRSRLTSTPDRPSDHQRTSELKAISKQKYESAR